MREEEVHLEVDAAHESNRRTDLEELPVKNPSCLATQQENMVRGAIEDPS